VPKKVHNCRIVAPKKRVMRKLHLLFVAVLLPHAACAPRTPSDLSASPAPSGDPDLDEATRSPTRREASGLTAPPRDTPRLLARTPSDHLALVDGHTGSLLADAQLGSGEGSRDVVFDPFALRALAFVGDGEEAFGELIGFDVGEGSFGPRKHDTWIDGDARIAVATAGTLVFVRAYGDQWRLLPRTGAFLASIPSPPPLSLQMDDGGFAALTLRAEGENTFAKRVARFEGGSWTSDPPSEIDVAASSDPPVARGVFGARGVLVEGSDAEVLVRTFDDDQVGPAYALGVRGCPCAIEHVASLPTSRAWIEGEAEAPDERFVVLVSGADRLVTFRLASSGAPHSVEEVALPGRVRVEPSFFSREIAVAEEPPVAFVATDAGVVAVDLVGPPIVRAAFVGNHLRGPLALVTP
jgi:hypothetical protein